ncbi:MAG: rhodanese-like domain-containing protein [Candidatus Parabeggiatoa sp. nov. 1]|nr:MAG: rhodanese-like domain-containing protein [Gammaproteobacteria bacterium]
MTHLPPTSESTASKLFWWLPFGKVPEILPTALAEKMPNPDLRPQLLDVRTRREWRNGHLAGAVSIPIAELRANIETLPFDMDKPVVAICLSAHRSIPAVRLLRRFGFTDVVQLAGGMIAWRSLSLPEQTEA